jgi:hypothetical protein
MAFKIHLLFAYIALCLLSLHADAFSLRSWLGKEPELVGFSWHNCGPGSDPFQVKSLDLTPDPVRVPGNVTVGISFSIGAASPTDIGVYIYIDIIKSVFILFCSNTRHRSPWKRKLQVFG